MSIFDQPPIALADSRAVCCGSACQLAQKGAHSGRPGLGV